MQVFLSGFAKVTSVLVSLCFDLENVFNETQEPASIQLWFDGGYFDSCSILNGLGCIRCPFLNTIAS